MIVRSKGGLTEFIPTPQEKRDGLIRDHALGLLENLAPAPGAAGTGIKAPDRRSGGLHGAAGADAGR